MSPCEETGMGEEAVETPCLSLRIDKGSLGAAALLIT